MAFSVSCIMCLKKKRFFFKTSVCHVALLYGIQWRFTADCANIINESPTNSPGGLIQEHARRAPRDEAKPMARRWLFSFKHTSWQHQCVLLYPHGKLATTVMWSIGCIAGLIFLVNVFSRIALGAGQQEGSSSPTQQSKSN